MNYWMLSISEENFEVTRAQGFSVQGFGTRQRRKTDRMVKGDRLLFYVKGSRVFPATATISSPVFEDESPLWTAHQASESFKYRVRISQDFVLPSEKYLRVNQIGPRMEYVRRWPPEMWHYALMDELHLLPRKDYEFIEGRDAQDPWTAAGAAPAPREPPAARGQQPSRELLSRSAQRAETRPTRARRSRPRPARSTSAAPSVVTGLLRELLRTNVGEATTRVAPTPPLDSGLTPECTRRSALRAGLSRLVQRRQLLGERPRQRPHATASGSPRMGAPPPTPRRTSAASRGW